MVGNILKVLTVESSKGCNNNKTETERSIIMDKYAQLNRFHHAFMYVDPQKMPVEEHFPATKIAVTNYKKILTPGPVPKYWLEFSYIHSEDYELDQNSDDTELKKQSDHTFNNKVKLFREIIVVVEEENCLCVIFISICIFLHW